MKASKILLGVIVLIVFFASDSQPGPTQYNADTMA